MQESRASRHCPTASTGHHQQSSDGGDSRQHKYCLLCHMECGDDVLGFLSRIFCVIILLLPEWRSKYIYLPNRVPEGSTNQAYSSGVYFKISWLFMERPCFFWGLAGMRGNDFDNKVLPSIFMKFWSRNHLNKLMVDPSEPLLQSRS